VATKKLLAAITIILLLPLIQPFPASAETDNGEDSTPESMTRIMMLPPDAEVTGMHIDANGQFFVNAMHPDDQNYKATIGVINGIDWNELPISVPELASTSSASDIWHGIRTSYGEYQVLIQSGDSFPEGGIVGAIYAADDAEKLFTSKKPDFNAFVPLNADGTRGYLYTAWEERPAGISQLAIKWNATTEEWDVIGGSMLDLSSINGGWVFCFGSISPWGTPLFSEELYFDDTKQWNDDNHYYHYDQERLENYLGFYPNPYDYGYILEIENPVSNNLELVKHFAMGRFSHENAQVMPDNRTVYLTDDGYDTVLFKFVADTAGDLNSGTLYAAKVSQDQSTDSATTGFDVEWLEMASSSNSVIESWISEYDGISTSDFVAGQNSYISDGEINDWAEGRLNQDLNDDGIIGNSTDDRVAFLESRKAAAALGASDEWNKMEGVSFNPNAPDYLYMAMSDVRNDMSDGQGDIDITQNRCGIVYRLALYEQWNVERIEPAISGGPYTSSANFECDINNLAGPDNLIVLDDGRLLIGEDTSKHENNMVWLWQPNKETDIVEGGEGDRIETISVSDVVQISPPFDADSLSTFSIKTEVDNLSEGVNYTAIIKIFHSDNTVEGHEWKWHVDRESDGQHNSTFLIQNGCYFVNVQLFEQTELQLSQTNASIFANDELNFSVGGVCENGEFFPELDESTDPELKDNEDSTGIPGFEFILSISAALVAAGFLRPKSENKYDSKPELK